MSLLVEILIQLFAWLLQVFYLSRFFGVLFLTLAIIAIGEFYLHEASIWRHLGAPLLFAGILGGLVWELAAWRSRKNRP